MAAAEARLLGIGAVTGVVVALVLAVACTAPSGKPPIPITPPAEVSDAPVSRVAVPESSVPSGPARDLPQIVIANVAPGTLYVCLNEDAQGQRQQTAIAFAPHVAKICTKHPEMGPCQYEREMCRRSGGRVFTADSREITRDTEAEYDKRVLRVRFRAD